MGRGLAVALAGALAVLGGCKADGPEPNVGAIADASYGDAPSRGVTSDLPDGLNLFGDGPDTSLSGNVGSTPVASSDANPDRQGNRPPDAGGGPADAGGGAGSCNLVQQDCAGDRGCYPVGAGSAGTCKPAGALVEHTPCDQHDDCAAGLACVAAFGGTDRLCEPLCDSTAVRPCPENRSCRPFGGSLVGTCEP